MNLFGTTAAPIEPATTGTDVLRARLFSHIRKVHPAALARDLCIGVGALDTFANGTGTLAPEVLDGLAKYFYDATFVPDLDRLRPLQRREVISMGITPPQVDGSKTPTFPLGITAHTGPQPLAPTPVPRPITRPGWV